MNAHLALNIAISNCFLSISSSLVIAGDGLREGIAGKPVLFTLDGRKAGGGQPTCRCTSPEGVNTDVLISDNEDGTFTVNLNAKEPGLHSVDLEWDGKPVPGSPFMVSISEALDPGMVNAHGPGLKNGILGKLSLPLATIILTFPWHRCGDARVEELALSASQS